MLKSDRMDNARDVRLRASTHTLCSLRKTQQGHMQ